MPRSIDSLAQPHPHVLYRQKDGAVPAGWWWHKLPATDGQAQVLAGAEGIDFDGPWSTPGGAALDYELNMSLAATQATA